VFLTASTSAPAWTSRPRISATRRVLAFKDNDVTALTLRGDGGGVVQLAKKNGDWWIEQPASYRADNNAVRALLSTVRNLRATDFANDNPADADLATYGLAPPAARAGHPGRGRQDGRPAVGKATDQGLYVKSSERPTTFIVGKWVQSDLGKGVNELRDKTLLTFDPTMASEIAVTRADGRQLHAPREGRRVVAGRQRHAREPAAATAFVARLSRLAGTQVLVETAPDLAVYGLAPPALTFTVTGIDGNRVGAVRLGSRTPDPPATQYTAQRDGDPAVMQLGEFQFHQLDRKPDDLTRAPAPPPDVGDAEEEE
jgi:hypothetical protein